ncbi:Aldo/keto reductase, partial [Microthyrium microscopicum]
MASNNNLDHTKWKFKLNTGDEIPAFGLGTWQSAPGQVRDAVKIALKNGYRHIDTALAYGNEKEVGLGIKDSGVPREEIWITTKLDNPWHKRVQEGIDTSLKDLGVEYVDLYLMHWPSSTDPSDLKKHLSDWDYKKTYIELQKLVGTGKIRNLGVSNFGIKHLEAIQALPEFKVMPAVNQIELHPNNPSPKYLEYCKSKGIHVTAYSCLGSTDSPLYKDEHLKSLAAKKGKTVQQILLVWGLKRGTSVIPKSVTESRILANQEIDGWDLTDEEMESINSLTGRFKVCGDAWLPEGVKVFFGDD